MNQADRDALEIALVELRGVRDRNPPGTLRELATIYTLLGLKNANFVNANVAIALAKVLYVIDQEEREVTPCPTT